MKRSLLGILALVLVFMLAGCQAPGSGFLSTQASRDATLKNAEKDDR